MQPIKVTNSDYPPEFPPGWAAIWGEDQYGLYADLVVEVEKGLSQRFRWLGPGEFMMGSPASEKDRYDDENYHQVTLSQGFWLADSTVNQALWQAVMGENPAKFVAANKPVEQVSWQDSKSFIDRLNERFGPSLAGLHFRLPTEAEWEHGCRAGTTSPFSFGANISPQLVNYNGKYPYDDGEKGDYRAETVEVKSLSPNPWGLYEMHGNVWEWCADYWQKQLGEQAVSDPYTSVGSGRVMRGGSWGNCGRDVRSAYRRHYSPALGSLNFGFRLLLGHELKSR